VKLPAAWLIEQCGWKGCRRDGLGIHPEHALVLVNYGSDSGAQLLALAADVAASVRDRFGVELEIEPRVYGGTR
jgi:UDP-N-acetylmuramate dehydrogenase